MQSERFVVKRITTRDCFVYLPDTWLRKLETKENVIEILHNNKTYYASWKTRPSPDNVICLGTSFARSLNIDDGDEVFVSSVTDVPSLKNVTVVPHSSDDREILELQMEKVQSTLLNQIRVVAKDQPIVVWVSKFSCVTLTTESLESNYKYGKLEQFTEVHVTDAHKKIDTNESSNRISSIAENLLTKLRNILPRTSGKDEDPNLKNTAARNYEFLQSFAKESKPCVFRVHCLPHSSQLNVKHKFRKIPRCPFHVFVPRSHVPPSTRFTNGYAMFNLKKVPEERQYVNVTSTNFLRNDESSTLKFSTELTVKLYVLEDVLERENDSSTKVDENYFNFDTLHSNIYVSESLRVSLNLKTGSRVILRHLEVLEDTERSEPSSIELFPWKESMTVETFEDYVKDHEGLLINTNSALVLEDGGRCFLRISPSTLNFAIVDDNAFKRLVVHSRSRETELPCLEDPVETLGRLEKTSRRHLRNVLDECQTSLDLSLGLCKRSNFDFDRENILISGEVGSGKTTVCKILMDRLQGPPYFVHVHMIDCKSLKGKKVEILQKLMTTSLSECVYYQPSVLFLDDLECITNASTNDEENTPDAINAARIADMLVNTVTQYQESHYVSIIATCTSVNRIGQKLRPARGAQFFRTVLSIPNLEKVDRIDILQLMLGDKLCVPGDVNWDYYGNKTEGWMPQDLVDMAEKATFAAWKRHVTMDETERSKGNSKSVVVITEDDMLVALKNSTPMSLQGIQLYKGSSHVWSDIGGLHEVKRSLTEILQWPLQYPEIFKNAPIKLQNGVLLYGMPGTGKTMLAKAIANECGVNLISVKGPELLSKYIGVSEESVRNVFERAQRAKPCVLFFDEFDSLAPRRGHDSTGVTDRVVNQLLTQLDGVEDREGVAVVAASSRPDLLDPALLRPGRLDKSLYCPLPTESDRAEILRALCNSQNVDTTELDLKELAELSSGFTGADLSAVVTQARLSAFEDAVAVSPNGRVEASDVRVTQKHLLDSVGSTHPSLSSTEKTKYKRIYARFSKGGNFTEDILQNQKATLA